MRTVRAKDQLYHLTCWQEAKPRASRPAPTTLRESMALLDPPEPLTRKETLAALLTLPMAGWVRPRLEQAQKRT